MWSAEEGGSLGMIPYAVLFAICIVQMKYKTLLGWFLVLTPCAAYALAVALTPPAHGEWGEYAVFMSAGLLPAIALGIGHPFRDGEGGTVLIRPKVNWFMSLTVLIALTLLIWTSQRLEGSEFSGGRVTGPILDLSDLGCVLLALSLVLAYLHRTSSSLTLAGSCLCTPLLIYFIAPGPFRSVFRGEYSVPVRTAFVWDGKLGVAAIALTVASALALRTFLRRDVDAPVHTP